MSPCKTKWNSPNLTEIYAQLLQTTLKSTKHPLSPKSIHAQIIKSGLQCGVFLINNLMTVYSKTGFITDAHKLFDEMPLKTSFSWNIVLSGYAKQGRITEALGFFGDIPCRDSVSWTSMIVGFNRVGQFDNAIRMFSRMVRERVAPSQFTVTNVFASCAAIKDLDVGRKVHSVSVKFGLGSYVSVSNSLMNMYAKAGDLLMAEVVFGRMSVRNVSSYNGMITLYMQSGQVDLAKVQFDDMCERDVVSWNSMIAGYNQYGHDVEALNLFSEMMKDHFLKPDRFTFATVLSACASLEIIKSGKSIHGYLIRNVFDISGAVRNALISMYAKSGGVEIAQKILDRTGVFDLDMIAVTALLDGYVKIGDVYPARKVFDSLKELDVVAWTAMIVGYIQNGLYNDALELFRSMISEGPKPNNYTLAAMLSVCSNCACLDHGKQIHAVVLRCGNLLSVSVSNALVNMYAKTGNINAARQVFNQSHWRRDTVSWTSMIMALAQHGLGNEAIEMFDRMLLLGIMPDHITYIGVLSACTHVGLVEKGRNYFSMMKNEHNIVPTLSHYACMIDLLGRAGLLEEAYNFILTMPIEPDVIAWGSLLASCRIQKNVDLAEVAAERLLSIEPGNSGAYSALANLYSACGRWADAAKIRKSMKDRGVKKEQGFSWMQIKDEVHIFGVEDWLHPQRDRIYGMMAKIWEEIKKMGFVPDTSSVLHDLEEEVKEQILRHHSEKLAIAFGLINTPDKSTLRIMKNLRVCNDCHTAIKFISKLVGREIVLRDATRFHHFKDGFCSCRDYW